MRHLFPIVRSPRIMARTPVRRIHRLDPPHILVRSDGRSQISPRGSTDARGRRAGCGTAPAVRLRGKPVSRRGEGLVRIEPLPVGTVRRVLARFGPGEDGRDRRGGFAFVAGPGFRHPRERSFGGCRCRGGRLCPRGRFGGRGRIGRIQAVVDGVRGRSGGRGGRGSGGRIRRAPALRGTLPLRDIVLGASSVAVRRFLVMVLAVGNTVAHLQPLALPLLP
mmetsp:Transcript_13742/g.33253  ORF Transcript_13742/g.33253 Transcript_13742/m.33253 type:complete len:221 (+) Transcript_13742:767-1429(+)